jgi:hypothetical protein
MGWVPAPSVDNSRAVQALLAWERGTHPGKVKVVSSSLKALFERLGTTAQTVESKPINLMRVWASPVFWSRLEAAFSSFWG